jgi:hypothetical protein
LNTRKSFHLEPFARNGIGKSRKNSKLLDVERLIQMAFFKNVRKFDTAKLFVGRHWIKIFAVCSGKKSIPQSPANLKQSKNAATSKNRSIFSDVDLTAACYRGNRVGLFLPAVTNSFVVMPT